MRRYKFIQVQVDPKLIAQEAFNEIHRSLIKQNGKIYYSMFKDGKNLRNFRLIHKEDWCKVTLKSEVGEFFLLSDLLEILDSANIRFVRNMQTDLHAGHEYEFVLADNSIYNKFPRANVYEYNIDISKARALGFNVNKVIDEFRESLFKDSALKIDKDLIDEFIKDNPNENPDTFVTSNKGLITRFKYL